MLKARPPVGLERDARVGQQFEVPAAGVSMFGLARWWEHAEAITRLEALWEAWEQARLAEGVGMAVWWRDYADPHMATLADAQAGPFTKCRAELGRHEVLAVWTADPAPAGLFRDAYAE